ncbi:MAG: hypothetical protein MH204_04940, partial [Fimbriimonadaceae bacterium]|nr:hypothetical protein [Fimbriimonadaceae bacterium]
QGVTWQGVSMQGLLMNSRMVQANFDDLNPETRHLWDGPDGPWDAEANADRFIAMLPVYAAHGLDAVTLNLQGGSPRGYSADQPWHNSAYRADGTLRPDYLARTARILDACDREGLVVILGLYYFGQDQRLADEAAVRRGVDEAVDWLLEGGWTNVVIEIANEVDYPPYDHLILKEARVHELILQARERSSGRLLVSASTRGDGLPPDSMIDAADFILLHGNSVPNADRIREMVAYVESRPVYRGVPIVFNEDDHFDFEDDDCFMKAAVRAGAGWGLFDYRMEGEGFEQGFQSVPTDWGIHSERKRGFFRLLREMTGGR